MEEYRIKWIQSGRLVGNPVEIEIGKCGSNIVTLVSAHFLKTNNVGIVSAQDADAHFFAKRPVVLTIVHIRAAYVAGYNPHNVVDISTVCKDK